MIDDKNEALREEGGEWIVLSLEEVTRSFGVSRELVIEIVNEGIVTVEVSEPNEWRFDTEALRCIRTSLCLHRDLGVNMAGAGLALELLKEIERLRALLKSGDHYDDLV